MLTETELQEQVELHRAIDVAKGQLRAVGAPNRTIFAVARIMSRAGFKTLGQLLFETTSVRKYNLGERSWPYIWEAALYGPSSQELLDVCI